MHLSKKAVVSGALAVTIALPMLTQAAELSSTQRAALEGLLNSFGVGTTTIAQVEGVISNEHGWGTASSTPAHVPPGQVAKAACIALTRNLTVGSSGEDVKKLQDLLRNDGSTGFTAASTGFFGPMTARAMAHYQMMNGIASTTSGNVGPLTRAFFERRCGEGVGGGKPQTEDDSKLYLPAFNGTVSSVNGSTFVESDVRGGSVTVHVGSTTPITVYVSTTTALRSGTLADIAVGKHVAGEGKKQDDGSINALRLMVGFPLAMPGGMMSGPGAGGPGSMMRPLGWSGGEGSDDSRGGPNRY